MKEEEEDGGEWRERAEEEGGGCLHVEIPEERLRRREEEGRGRTDRGKDGRREGGTAS